jgi:hypothetical protein
MATNAFHKERMERTATVRLPNEGKPFRREHVVEMLLRTSSRADIEALGQREQGATWEVTFKSEEAKVAFLAAEEHVVKGYKASVTSAKRGGHKMRIFYLPYYVPTTTIAEILQRQAGAKVVFAKNELDRNDGLPSNVRFVVVETDHPEAIPDVLKWTFEGLQGSAVINVHGRSPLCFRCNERGHRKFECQAPYCATCRRVGHEESEQCGRKLYSQIHILSGTAPADEDNSEDMNDDDEAAYHSGDEPPPAAGDAVGGAATAAAAAVAAAVATFQGSTAASTEEDAPRGQGATTEATQEKEATTAASTTGNATLPSWEEQMAAEDQKTEPLIVADRPQNRLKLDGRVPSQDDKDGYHLVGGRKRSSSTDKSSAKSRLLHKSSENLADPTARKNTAPRNPSTVRRGGHASGPAGKNPVGKNGTLTSADFLKG